MGLLQTLSNIIEVDDPTRSECGYNTTIYRYKKFIRVPDTGGP